MTEQLGAGSAFDAARAWIAQDPDPDTQAELQGLVDAGDRAELTERMHAPLAFGTAGLRGVVGAGLARMNRAVVIRATRGVADYLLARVPDSRTLPVVVGYDGRLSSRGFAEDTTAVLLAAGIPVRVFEEPVPTPLVAYAAKQLGAQAAVVVTASHNPPEYNGYKLYGPNAVQIVPPADSEIAERIAAVRSAKDVARVDTVQLGRAEAVPADLFDRYLAEVDAARPSVARDTSLRIVYTPLHGVGWKFLQRTLAFAGYNDVHVVPQQAEPDGRFPTVNFPNPEEPGALDLAQQLADEVDAQLILANDPDADRLAACVPTPAGRFRQLSGNQIGLLLADFLLEHALRAPQPLVISSLVSSPMLASIAARHGARAEQTLTGFKWIWNAALDLEREQGARFAFGYEEALGYSVGRIVYDKDGISAALLLADLAAHCQATDTTLSERLDQLYRRHGLWVSVQHSENRPGTEGQQQIAAALQRLGASPPTELSGRTVARVTDYRQGASERPRYLAQAQMIAFELEGGGRVLVRPSGTEPKLKFYVDLRRDLDEGQSARSVEQAALQEAQALAKDLAQKAGL